MEAGSRVLELDNEGRIPLTLSAQEGHLECVRGTIFIYSKKLSTGTENINEVDGVTIFSILIDNYDVDIAGLVEHGAPVNHRSHDGKSVLRAAALEGHRDTVQYLIQCGADINYRDADGRTTLYLLALENQVKYH